MDHPLAPATAQRPWPYDCVFCGHPFHAASREGLQKAIEAHGAFVNDTKDRTTDPHFESGNPFLVEMAALWRQ